MITNICLLLEILSVVCCLHCLYNEKFKLDIATISFLAIYMILMTAMNYYNLSLGSIAVYFIVFLYCGIRFGFHLKVMIINNILYMIIVSGVQLIVMLLNYYIMGVDVFYEVRLLFVNCICFCVLILLLPKCKLHKLSVYLQDKERILFAALFISIFIAAYCLVSYKKVNTVELNQSVLLFVSVAFICILVSLLGKYKIKAKEIEIELKMHQLYSESFDSLISDIRMRQHEFDNHINTIYSQHFMYNTFEELVNAQESYCQLVVKENRFNKLLTSGNPVVIGFLYGRFVEIEKLGIEILYKVNIEDLDVGIPIYKIVEILGNLINNAVEALQTSGIHKDLYVAVIENSDNLFQIEVRNKSKFISCNEIDAFFRKGFSEKGVNRGLGLYNVKTICNKYSLHIFCENKIVDNGNWLSFCISNKKEII